MGTPEFAVEPLRAILSAGYKVVAIVTAPDKPAGRGQKLHSSPVKEFALHHNLPILQPLSLKNSDFISELRKYDANLQVVVAFRMLPEVVWQMPEYGTINLHASLLPQYRGAAPINHAIINGETETGLTTFFIEKEIDTGKIVLALKVPVLPSDNAGVLHDRLMVSGGEVMLDTLKLIAKGEVKPKSQESFATDLISLHPAPKILKNDCKINWDNTCVSIHNLVRGLSPFPCAFSNLIMNDKDKKHLKIFKTSYELSKVKALPGTIIIDNKKSFSVFVRDGIINIEELQIEGKRRVNASEFLHGVHSTDQFRFEL